MSSDPVTVSFTLSDVMRATLMLSMKDVTKTEWRQTIRAMLDDSGRLTFSRLPGYLDVADAESLLPFLRICSEDKARRISPATRQGFSRRAWAIRRWLNYDAVSIIGAMDKKENS